MLSRYHLWFADPSRETASWSANILPRGNGRSRNTPTERSSRCLGVSSTVYSAGVLLPFPPARGSLGKASPRTSPFLRYIQGLFYPINMGLSIQIPSFLPPKKGSRPRFPGKSRRLRRTASQHANDTVNKQEASRSPKVTFPDTFPPGPAVPQHFSAVPLSPGCRR